MATLLPVIFLNLFSLFNLFGILPEPALTQLMYVAISFGAYMIIKKMGRPFFQTNARFFYWMFVVILIVTFIIGFEVKGSKRWIDLFFFNFQASEFFKIFFILFMAERFSHNDIRLVHFPFFLTTFLYFLVPTFIIFKQPDLGNAMVFLLIYFVMLFFSGVPRKYIMYVLLIILLCLPVGWLSLKQYQRARIVSFIQPQIDMQGTSYNMAQAVITIGSGNFFGHGLGLGTQSRLFFLPENRTDFAFASLVEQFGFFGGIVVIGLYMRIAYILIKKILHYYYKKDHENKFAFLYCLGLTSYILFQVYVNIGMNLGILPIAGITLPFISYGGSSLLALMIGLALLP